MRDLIHPFWCGPPLIQYGPILDLKTCCVASVYQTKHTVSAFGPYFWRACLVLGAAAADMATSQVGYPLFCQVAVRVRKIGGSSAASGVNEIANTLILKIFQVETGSIRNA